MLGPQQLLSRWVTRRTTPRKNHQFRSETNSFANSGGGLRCRFTVTGLLRLGMTCELNHETHSSSFQSHPVPIFGHLARPGPKRFAAFAFSSTKRRFGQDVGAASGAFEIGSAKC